MPSKRSAKTKTAAPGTADRSIADGVASAMGWLKDHATQATLAGMARYGLPSDHALGVGMADIKVLGKELGRDHALALALWDTGCYEARLLCSFVDEPQQVTVAQMDRWCADFDNWGICDTLCFNLFDRAPHAWSRVEPWSERQDEFGRRAAFALLWALALHDKSAGDEAFERGLALIAQAADDDRNFVKKAVAMALRAIGLRNARLRDAASAVAQDLTDSKPPSARWIGRDVLRKLGG
jgi:3-methyladenine DNA glycosylase AlkD